MDSVLCSEQLDQARVSRHRGRVFSITARKGGTCTMKGADRFMPWTSFHSGMIWMANLFDVQLRWRSLLLKYLRSTWDSGYRLKLDLQHSKKSTKFLILAYPGYVAASESNSQALESTTEMATFSAVFGTIQKESLVPGPWSLLKKKSPCLKYPAYVSATQSGSDQHRNPPDSTTNCCSCSLHFSNQLHHLTTRVHHI